MRPRPVSTVSTALIAAGRLPVWPTMSGLAKFSTIRSYFPEPIACDRLVRQLGRGHFRLQVVGRDLGDGTMMRSSPRIGRLLAAVQEIGDVRIFLGLRHAELRARRRRRPPRRACCAWCCGGNSVPSSASSVGAVAASCRRRRRSGCVRGRGKPSKSGSSSAVRISPHPVGAEIEAQQAVAVLHAPVVADHGGARRTRR